jgi:aquaporin Z
MGGPTPDGLGERHPYVAGVNEDEPSTSKHWPEYLAEAAGLGVFLLAVGGAVTLLEYPGSPLQRALPWPLARRMMSGLFVGVSIVLLVYSPLGRLSGAHLNPAITLGFYRLGKISGHDAIFYVTSQFAGGTLGLVLLSAMAGPAFTAPPVLAAVTKPGAHGAGLAFLAEVVMSFGVLFLILVATNRKRLYRKTGFLVGALVATYVVLGAPLSGMSINPARSFASAVSAHFFGFLWIYFTAPPFGMLLAAELYQKRMRRPVICAKMDHTDRFPCIFNCGFRAGMRPA